MATSRTATATTLPARTRMRPIAGPALGHAPVPLQSVLISTLGHVMVAGVVVGSALLWPGEPTKTYVVNLVAAVPAVGVSQGKPATPTKAPVPPPKAEERPAKPEPRESTPPPKAAVERPSKTAPEPPRKAPELPTKATPDLPARAKPIEMPARERPAESAALPDRTLPVREPGLPRASQKELPPMASAVPPKAPPLPAPPPPPAPTATPSPRVVSVAPPTPPAPLGAPTGTAQGSGAVLNTTGGDFPFTWYLRQVTQRINQQWDGRARQGQQPMVVFEISPDGRVARLKIEKSSGDEVYDRAALRAIADASPFPPLPDEFKTPPLRVHLGFSYGGDRG